MTLISVPAFQLWVYVKNNSMIQASWSLHGIYGSFEACKVVKDALVKDFASLLMELKAWKIIQVVETREAE